MLNLALGKERLLQLVLQECAVISVTVACRFTSNIGILLLNKHLLGGYGFRFPIFLTLCHMLACVVLSQVGPPAFCNSSVSCNPDSMNSWQAHPPSLQFLMPDVHLKGPVFWDLCRWYGKVVLQAVTAGMPGQAFLQGKQQLLIVGMQA